VIYGNQPGARPIPPWSERAKRNVRWIHKHCRVPDGPKAGQKIRLTEYQKNFFRVVYQWDDRLPRTVIETVARKNAKTAKVSMVVLLHTLGPEARPYQELVTTARVKDQAGQTYKYCANSIKASPTLRDAVDLKDAQKEYTVKELLSTYKALSKEAKSKLGGSPAVAVHDEAGAITGPEDDLIDAIETGMKAHESPISFYISTQAPDDGDMLSLLIDDALARPDDEAIVLFMYAASKEREDGVPEEGKRPEEWAVPPDPDYPFSDEALRDANPEAGILCSWKELHRDRDKAQRLPSFENKYRNLTLNQRVEQEALFLSRSLWAIRARPELVLPPKDVPTWWGLDLSSVGDLTAEAALWDTGVIHKVPMEQDDGSVKEVDVPEWAFWARGYLPDWEIKERARRDKVPYDVWARQGHLQLIKGKAIDYNYVAAVMKRRWAEQTIVRAGFDRWQWNHFKDCLKGAGMAASTLETKWLPIGMGSASLTPILREIESRVMAGSFIHPHNPVFNMCISNVVTRGPDNARTFEKKHPRARIDLFAALACAVGARLQSPRPPKTPEIRFI
jgi:phage terminase large subunit-like protein